MQSSRSGGSPQPKRAQPGGSSGSGQRSGYRPGQRSQGAASSTDAPAQGTRQRTRAQQQQQRQPDSSQDIAAKVQTLRDEKLRQIREMLQHEPDAEQIHVLDMLLEEARTLVHELTGDIEVYVANNQFDLVERVFMANDEFEDLKTHGEQLKERYRQTVAAPPADSRRQREEMEEQEALRRQAEEAQHRREAEEAEAEASRQRNEFAARQRQEEEARRAEEEVQHAAQLEAQREAEVRMRQQAEETRQPIQRSAIEEAQRRSGGLEEQSGFQVQSQRFQEPPLSPPQVWPPPETVGSWPAAASDGAGLMHDFHGVGGSPSSQTPVHRSVSQLGRDVIAEQKRSQAEQTLLTILQGEMRQDFTVLQWAVTEAQKAGVAQSNPALVAEGERQLEQASAATRTQAAMHELEMALASDARTAQSVREAVDKAHAAGVTPLQTAPARAALATLESKELELQQAEHRNQEAVEQLRAAEQGGDPVKLEAAMERARAEGVREEVIEGAEKNLRAMRFLMKLRKHASKGPLLNAWRRHILDVKSARAVLKDALIKGVHAETLEEHIDDAREAGVDDITCDMAQTVANHRKSAHQQAEHALETKSLEELQEAKSMNTAAGGPKADVARLDFAIAEAEEDERMLQSWDVHLPAAVDGYFEILETSQREAKELQTGLASLRVAHGLGASAPPKAAAKAGPKVAATPKVKAEDKSLTPKQAVPKTVPPKAVPPKATPPKAVAPVITRPMPKREEEDEWEREYRAMKSQVEHARQLFALQEQQHRHEEQLKKLERLRKEEEEREAAEERRQAADDRQQRVLEDQRHESSVPLADANPSKNNRSGTPRRSRWSLCGGEEDSESEAKARPTAKAPAPKSEQPQPGPTWQTAFQRRREAERDEAKTLPTPVTTQHLTPERQQVEQQQLQQQHQHSARSVCPGFGGHSRKTLHSPAPGVRNPADGRPEAESPATQTQLEQKQQQHQQQHQHQLQRTHSARSVCPGFGSHNRKRSHSPAPGGREALSVRPEPEISATQKQHEQQQVLGQQQQKQQQHMQLQQQQQLQLQEQQQHPKLMRGVPTVSSGQGNPFATHASVGGWDGACRAPSGSIPADGQPAAVRGCSSIGSVSYAVQERVPGCNGSGSSLGATSSLWPPHSASQASGGAGSKLLQSAAGPPLTGVGGGRGLSGADAAAGCGLDLKGYGDYRGTNSFYDLMANASDIARRPEAEPRRHYEEHSFWRH